MKVWKNPQGTKVIRGEDRGQSRKSSLQFALPRPAGVISRLWPFTFQRQGPVGPTIATDHVRITALWNFVRVSHALSPLTLFRLATCIARVHLLQIVWSSFSPLILAGQAIITVECHLVDGWSADRFQQAKLWWVRSLSYCQFMWETWNLDILLCMFFHLFFCSILVLRWSFSWLLIDGFDLSWLHSCYWTIDQLKKLIHGGGGNFYFCHNFFLKNIFKISRIL